MLSLTQLVQRYSDIYSEFLYYIPIIEKAQKNELQHPDITIECCASLFQGVSKSIVHRLDPDYDKKALEKLPIQQQVKTALKCLKEHDDVIEDEFARSCETLVRLMGTLRNARGDISHGRAAPKELQSDRSLARLALNMTEGLLRYMLASFFALYQPVEEFISYDKNSDFNDHIDDQYPLDGKTLYSRAVYEQYPEEYLIQLEDYRDEMEELKE